MPHLHIVSQSPHRGDALASCLRLISTGDSLLLTEDGVFAALSRDIATTSLTQAVDNKIALFVLNDDLKLRGLDGLALTDGIVTIDRSGFVDLVAKLDSVHSWF